MRIWGKISGGGKLKKTLQNAMKPVDLAGKGAVKRGVLEIQRAAIKNIQAVSTGQVQVRYSGTGGKRTVVASKPGDPPNTDTGRLIQSVGIEILEDGMVGKVGTNLKYGKYLELGTKSMEPRPWLSPALDQAGAKIGKIYAEEFNKGLQKAFGIPKPLFKAFKKASKRRGRR